MKKSNKGFTLIELLVVIAIIALLLSIITPSLTLAKEKARQLQCQANMKNVAYILTTYSVENDNKLPSSQWRAPAGWVRIGWFNNVPFNVAKDIREQFAIETLFCPANPISRKRDDLDQYALDFLNGPSSWEEATPANVNGNVVSDYFWLLSFNSDWRVKPEYIYPDSSRYSGRPLFISDLNGKSLSTTVLAADVVGYNPSNGDDDPDFTDIRDGRFSSNHVKGIKARGGNAVLGDGSVRWVGYPDMSLNHAFDDYKLFW